MLSSFDLLSFALLKELRVAPSNLFGGGLINPLVHLGFTTVSFFLQTSIKTKSALYRISPGRPGKKQVGLLKKCYPAEAEVCGFLYLAPLAPHELGHCCKLVLGAPGGGANARNAFFFPDVIPFTHLTSHGPRITITAPKMSIVF